jgi:MFS family permease
MPITRPRIRLPPLPRDRNVALLLTGQGLSQFGNEFYVVALPWLFLEVHRFSSLGVVLAGYGIGRIIALVVGGIATDRLGARATMLFADAGRFLLTGLLWLDADSIAHNLAAGFPLITALGLLTGVFQPAYATIVPQLASPDGLAVINSASTAVTGLASLAGPVTAGIVVSQADPSLAFGVDALSFLASLLSLACMREMRVAGADDAPAPPAGAPRRRLNWLAEWTDIVRTMPTLRVTVRVMIVANLTWAALVEIALPRLIYNWSGSSSGYGLVLGGAAVGVIVGSLFAPALARRRQSGGLAMLAGIVEAACIAATPLARGPYGATALFVLLGVANCLTNIVMITLLQQSIPMARMGRAMAFVQFCNYAPYSVSALLGSVVTSAFGPSAMFEITAIGLTLAFLSALARPPYQLSRLPSPGQSGAGEASQPSADERV